MNELGKPILKTDQIFLKKTEHSQQIAGKRPPLTGLLHIGIETEKKEKLTEIFLFFNVKKF